MIKLSSCIATTNVTKWGPMGVREGTTHVDLTPHAPLVILHVQHIVHEHVLVGRGERSSTLTGQPIVQENLGGS